MLGKNKVLPFWERVKPLLETLRILAEYAKAKGKPAPEWRG